MKSKDAQVFKFAAKRDIRRLIEISGNIQRDYLEHAEAELAGLVAKKQVLCIMDGSSIAGYLQWRTEFMGEDSSWYLEQVTVDRGHRRKGFATQLVLRFLSIASKNGTTKAFLDVQTYNVASIALFTKNGFRIVGMIEGLGTLHASDKRIVMLAETRTP